MARLAREISETGLYHVVFRGINHQHIFEESSDYEKFKSILIQLKNEMHYQIYVYCIMSNHVHILLKENNSGDISLIMKRLLTKYVRWFNTKYDRCGTLIANRYKSKPVDIDEYFLSVVRYIHQNPIKAKIVDNISDYEWSSYKEYTNNTAGVADKDFILEMMTIDDFIKFHKENEPLSFSVNDKIKPSDDEVKRNIQKKLKTDPKLIGSLEKNKRDEILKDLKCEYSIRQLERITGISRGIIYKS